MPWKDRIHAHFGKLFARTSANTASGARRLDVMDLEDRVMYSATPIDLGPLVESAHHSEPTQSASVDAQELGELLRLDPAEDGAAPEGSRPASPADGHSDAVVLSEANPASRELVFIDSAVGDPETLVSSLQNQDDSTRQISYVVLDAREDGVEQITRALTELAGIDAVHIVSHGSESGLQLGSSWLTRDSFELYREEFARWSGSLSDGADLLFYGCDLAQSESGRDLLNQIAVECDCDVTASDDLTGHESLGGDWVLEHAVGEVSTEVAFGAAAQQAWTDTLATITVTTLADENDGDTSDIAALQASSGGAGISLREAVIAANNTAGADTIVLGAGVYVLDIAGNDDTSAAGDLDINSDITIVGDSAATTTIDASGYSERIMEVRSGGDLTISNMTLTGANTGAHGAAVYVSSGRTFSATDVVFSNNTSTNDGGHVMSYGTTDLNRVAMIGGSADMGGALRVAGGATTLTNVTISGNTAAGADGGGGVWVDSGTLNLAHTTIAGNTAQSGPGGGINVSGGGLNSSYSIIADNTAASGGDDLNGNFITGGYNVIEHNSGFTGAGVNDIVGSDPGLSALSPADGTYIHTIAPSSVAYDSGTGSTEVVDQRAASRDANPDIGAYEYVPVLTVDTTSDVSDGDTSSIAALLGDRGADGFISLREAITAANNTANVGAPDEIHFEIAAALVGGAHTIQPTSALPTITEAVVIDGTTDSDFAGTPIIELDGTSAGSSYGLLIDAGGSTVEGLVINRFELDGIRIQNGSGNSILGNYLGTNVAGDAAAGNGEAGIEIRSTGNTIGGAAVGEGNLISGNTADGIFLNSAGASGNTILGNTIGANAAGDAAIANDYGVSVTLGANTNTIGGTGVGEGNLIYGNTNSGVRLGGGDSNRVLGNSIIANGGLAIDLEADGVTNNDAEDVDTGANDLLNFPVLTSVTQDGGNLGVAFSADLPAGDYRIEFFDNPSGLDGSGFGEGESFLGALSITATGAAGYETFTGTLSSVTPSDVTNVTVTATEDLGGGNYGSTSEFGPQFAGFGVLVVDTTSDTADGDTSSIAALLGDRGADGFISLREAITAANNTANGASPDEIRFEIPGPGTQVINLSSELPQITDAIVIDGTTQNGWVAGSFLPVVIDGAGVLEGLVFATGADDSTARGLVVRDISNTIVIDTGVSGVTIVGNFLGSFDSAGAYASGNESSAAIVYIEGDDFTVGGATVSDRNLIGGGNNGVVVVGSTGGAIAGNYIGLEGDGSTAIAIVFDGVRVDGATGITIGGATAAHGNVIAGVGDDGVELSAAGVTNSVVQNNLIGVSADGATGIGVSGDGIAVPGPVSGVQLLDNLIALAGVDGIDVSNTGSGLVIQGNTIGTDAGGTQNWGVTDHGVYLRNGLTGALVGGVGAGQGNRIANSGLAGIAVEGAATDGHALLGNSITSSGGLAIDLGSDGVSNNDSGDGDAGANDLQNYPVLSSAVTDGAIQVTVSGSLNSSASTDFRIEFFASGTGDGTGHGEAERYLGSTTVTTDGAGNAAFSPTISAAVAAGEVVTATATVDLGGGAYGDTSEMAANVTAAFANSAPVLDNTGTMAFNAISEDDTNDAGQTVASVIASAGGDRITDADGQPEGIAITAQNESGVNGWFEYSLDAGANWTRINYHDNSSALLLRSTDLLRFMPQGGVQETASLTFRAWDQTSGSAGQSVDVSTNGGTTAFSTATETASITTTIVNDAPEYGAPDPGVGVYSEAAGVDDGWNQRDVIELADGGFLVVGWASVSGDDQIALTRFLSDGSVDTSFGNGGRVLGPFVGVDDFGYAVAEQADGDLVVAGYVFNGVDNDAVAVRFLADGTLDTSFGTSGSYQFDNGGDERYYAIAIQPDGDIVLGGETATGSLVTRLLSDGTTDNGFSTDGWAEFQFDGGSSERVTALDLQSDGRIILGGEHDPSGTDLAYVARLTTSGTLDTGFGTSGITSTDFGTGNGVRGATDVLIQADGRIVLTGAERFNWHWGLTRLDSSGSIDTGFGTSGHVVESFGGNWGNVAGVEQQADGKLVVGGYIDFGYKGQSDWVVARYNTDGSTDATYGDGGFFSPQLGSFWNEAYGMDLTADGGVVLAGHVSDIQGTAIGVFTSGGALDTSIRSGLLDGAPTYVEGDPAAVLDGDVFVFDADLFETNYDGATLTLARNGGASAEDVYTATGTLGALTQGGSLVVNGTTIGAVTTNSGGTLVLSFDANATQERLNEAVRQIAYSNSSGSPPASVQIDWTFDDGGDSVVTQGSPGAQQGIGSTTVSITRINDAPSGADNTVATNEDTDYTFAAGDFGFSDSDGDSLAAVVISTLPSNGTLYLDADADGLVDGGEAVSASQVIALADITAGRLKFKPAADANGLGYDAFTFQVRDDGGTANGGADTDATPNTLTIDVTSVNDAPSGANNTVTTNEDTDYTIAAGDFGFSDSDGDSLSAVVISSLPSNGTLYLDANSDGTVDGGEAVSASQVIAVADLTAGRLKFKPVADANGTGYDSFTFQVRDDGGTANGGVDTDATPNTLTIDVDAVNDAPSGANNTVTTNEDTDYTFAAGDFGFSDTDGDSLAAVVIATLPTNGTLYLDADSDGTVDGGEAVSASQVIAVADITAGRLKFKPAADANGLGYDAFTFQVRDDGGTANGGADTDATPNTLTIDVDSVNDAPSNAGSLPTDVAVVEDVSSAIDLSSLSLADVDAGAGVVTITLTTSTGGNLAASTGGGVVVSGSGSATLTLDGTLAALNSFLGTAGNVTYLHATPGTTGDNADAISVVVNDNGNTGAGGGTDVNLGVVNVDIGEVNDPPGGTDSTVTTDEDTDYVFAAGDFGFSDTDGGSLSAVVISSLPSNGTLYLDGDADGIAAGGEAITASQAIAVADITAGRLKFKPAADANGLGYDAFTFQVRDDGGTAAGGVDTDPTPNTITIDVNAVNDSPQVGANTGATVAEGGSVTITTAMLDEADIDDAGTGLAYTVTGGPTNGRLELTTNPGVAITGFTQDDLDNNRVVFTHNGAQASADAFSFNLNDGGEDGATPATGTFNFSVTNVNDPPVNTVPGFQVVDEDTPLVISGLSVADVDDNLSGVQLSVANGTLNVTLSGTTTIIAGANGSATVTLAGALADINATLSSLTYQGIPDYHGVDTLTVLSTDSDSAIDSDTVAITVNSVNDDPVNAGSLPSDVVVTEDVLSDIDLSAVDLDDVDAAGGSLTVTLSTSTGGQLTVLAGSGVTLGGTAAAATFTGTLVDLNNYFDTPGNLRYLHGTPGTAGDNADAIQVEVSDNGAAGAGGGGTIGLGVVNIDIGDVNDAPVNTTPGTATVLEETPAAIVGLSIADPDAGGGVLSTQLQVTNGVLDVTLGGSATISGGAIGTNDLTIQGTLADINATLASLTYTGAIDVTGLAADTLTITTNDLGNTGLGGPRQDVDAVQINISDVNDAPVGTAESYTTLSTRTLSVAAPGVLANDLDVDSPSLTVVLVTPPSTGSLTLMSDGSFTYAPAPTTDGLVEFTYRVFDGGLSSDPVTVGIVVTVAPDNPSGPEDPGDGEGESGAGDDDSPSSEDPVQEPTPIPTPDPPVADTPPLYSTPPRSIPSVPGLPADGDRAPVVEDERAGSTMQDEDEFLAATRKTTQANWSAAGPSTGLDPAGAGDASSGIADYASYNLDLIEHLLDAAQEDQPFDREDAFTAGAATSVAIGLSAGYLAWAMRSAYLVAAMAGSLPAWARFDPIYVLDEPGGQRQQRNREMPDTSLADLAQSQGAAR